MPNMNGAGPRGEGPKTGRGLGKCGGNTTSNNAPINNGRGLGRGNRPGQGLGRRLVMGRGRGQNQTSS
ncbi:MAG: hypothetical protein BWY53_00725 [Parcubacteria group bacterium ADurb.Bin326]|nr:MAG: hypothetical protein BWY53_00725 [Parcubacteria group bacterium ADurb.Bin326]